MKKSYIILLIIETILIISLYMLFKNDSINKYILIILLELISLIAIKITIGYEKNRNSNTKDITINMFICITLYQIIIYLIGIQVGFLKNAHNLELFSIIRDISPIIAIIIITEILRYSLTKKSEKSKILLIIICITFIFIEINLYTHLYDINNLEDYLKITLEVVMPSITNNILLTYTAKNFGYKPSIVYRLIKELPVYIMPLIPNLGEYIYTIVNVTLPILILYIINKDYQKLKEKNITYNNRITTIIMLLTSLTIVIITSGNFKIYGLSIASNSMSKTINKGDLIIVEKLNQEEVKELVIGDILVYEYQEKVIVHRIVEISNDKFKTKGDNNEVIDNYTVNSSDVIGKVKLNIKYIGYPSVLLYELINN